MTTNATAGGCTNQPPAGQPEPTPGVIVNHTDPTAAIHLSRDQLAALLAHHADVLAANLRTDGTTGLPENSAGIKRAAELLDLHAEHLTAEKECAPVTELLDSILAFPAYREAWLTSAVQQPAAVSAVVSPPTSRAAIIAEVLPDWEAMYEPGNVSDYLIGYANDEHAAKGAAEAWMRSQAEVTGRLEWVPDDRLATGRYDRWFELVERHDDGVDTGPGIVVRRRLAAEAQQQPDTEALTAEELAHALDNSTPYPIELDGALCRFMAERLLEMTTAHKRPEHAVWQPDEELPADQPAPIDPATLAPAPVAQQPAAEVRHTGGNAEDCPACGANGLNKLGYPWTCPEDEQQAAAADDEETP